MFFRISISIFFRPGNDQEYGRNSFSEVETYAQEVILHKSQSDPKKHFNMYVAGMSWSDLGITSWYSNEVWSISHELFHAKSYEYLVTSTL